LAYVCTLAVAGAVRLPSALAADSVYGTVIDVRSADQLTVKLSAGIYQVRIVGVEAPSDPILALQAIDFVTARIRGAKVRLRLEERRPTGEWLASVDFRDASAEVQDVGVELVRAGLARRRSGIDHDDGAMKAAEDEARTARRGLWASTDEAR
jgi:endonuclease YncB( thermonuclease family)